MPKLNLKWKILFTDPHPVRFMSPKEFDDLPSVNSMLFYWYYFPAILVLLLPSHLYLKKPIEKKIIRTCDKGGGGIKKVKKDNDIYFMVSP
jgi:hypothetical protein